MRMRACVASLLIAAATTAYAQEISVPKGDYKVAYLQLEGKVAGKTDSWKQPLMLTIRGDKVVQAWVPRDIVVPDVSGLVLQGGSIKGELVDKQVGQTKGLAYRYTLDLNTSGEKIDGSFKLNFQDGTRMRAVEGKASGMIKTSEQLRSENALNPQSSWPAWRGPNGNMTASATPPLIDNLSEAKWLWRGEEEQPGSPGRSGGLGRKLGGVPKTRVTGGGATPAVGEGKVLVSYFYPSGDVLDKRGVTELTKLYGADFANKDKIRVSADDIVLCLDAATGQTLWKTTFKDKGMNWQEHKSSPNNLAPVIHNGKVIAVGSTLRLYCLDLSSGKMLWESNLGPKHKAIEAAKAKGLETQAYQGGALGNRHMGGAGIIIGGVYVINDQASDVCGFDVETGKELWRTKDVNDPNSPPAKWTHAGMEYAIASSPSGLACIHPKTGDVIWKVATPVGGAESVVNVSGDYLVTFERVEKKAVDEIKDAGPAKNKDADGDDEPTGEAGFATAFQLSPAGAKQLWKKNTAFASTYAFPHLMGNRMIVSGRNKTEVYDVATGNVLSTIEGPGAGNGGHIFSAGDRVFLSLDGKHGQTRLVTYVLEGNTLKPGSAEWMPPHPNTTAYGHTMATYPVVDGRIFIRGGDAIYCYDLRKK